LLVGGDAEKHLVEAGEEKQVMTDEHAQRVFLALADPTRRLLLQQLCEEGSGTAAGFATRLPITRQAIIKHLMTLEQAGLVTARETGRERRYMPRPDGLQAVMTWIEEISAQWDQRLAALRSYLLDEPRTPAVPAEEHAIMAEHQERINEHDSSD
jgi:DNA-binding transcriptional ArsR family regulator